MQDGYSQSGAGQDDRRMGGRDLQHNVQLRTADEAHEPVRRVERSFQGGGPMKEATEQQMHTGHHGHHSLGEHLEHEKSRHHHSHEHMKHHLEKHHGRHHDSQYGHDNHNHNYGEH